MRAESGGPGRGATFTFTIKVPVAALPAQGRREIIGTQPSSRAGACWSWTTTPPTAACCGLQAAKWGMVPADTESPEEALRWIAEGQAFDLAILDMHMPRDGRAHAGAADPREERHAAAGAVQLAGAQGGRRRRGAVQRLSREAAAPEPAVRHAGDDPRARGGAQGRRRGQAAHGRGDGEPPSAAHPAGGGQRRQPEARAAHPAADGVSCRSRLERHRGRRSRWSGRRTMSS